MNFKALTKSFVEALSDTRKFVEGRPSMPILNNVNIVASVDPNTGDSVLTIYAINLSDGVSIARIVHGAIVTVAGSVTLPSKTLDECIKNSSGDTVEFKVAKDTQIATIRSGGGKSTIKGISSDEYPTFSDVPTDLSIFEASFADVAKLKRAVELGAFAFADNNSRPALTGIFIEAVDDNTALKFVTADGYELAYAQCECEVVSSSGVKNVLVPAAAFHDALTVMRGGVDIRMGNPAHTKTQIVFTVTDGVSSVSIQTLDYKFPDYQSVANSVLNKVNGTSIVVNGSELQQAIKISEIFSRDSVNKATLQIGRDDVITLSGKSQERGDSETELKANMDGYQGSAATVSFNVKYLGRYMSAVKPKDDSVTLSVSAAGNPILCFGGEPEYKAAFILMPMG